MSSYAVRYDQAEGVVRVEIRGNFDAKLLSESTAALSLEIEESGSNRILMDHREATPKLTVSEQYDRPGIAFKLGVPRSCRIAIVCRAMDEVYRFIETVGVNSGYTIKVFLKVDEALRWLRN